MEEGGRGEKREEGGREEGERGGERRQESEGREGGRVGGGALPYSSGQRSHGEGFGSAVSPGVTLHAGACGGVCLAWVTSNSLTPPAPRGRALPPSTPEVSLSSQEPCPGEAEAGDA